MHLQLVGLTEYTLRTTFIATAITAKTIAKKTTNGACRTRRCRCPRPRRRAESSGTRPRAAGSGRGSCACPASSRPASASEAPPGRGGRSNSGAAAHHLLSAEQDGQVVGAEVGLEDVPPDELAALAVSVQKSAQPRVEHQRPVQLHTVRLVTHATAFEHLNIHRLGREAGLVSDHAGFIECDRQRSRQAENMETTITGFERKKARL